MFVPSVNIPDFAGLYLILSAAAVYARSNKLLGVGIIVLINEVNIHLGRVRPGNGVLVYLVPMSIADYTRHIFPLDRD